MELPEEIVDIIKQFSKPLGMKPRPTPSCIAIYRSDIFRDYRCECLADWTTSNWCSSSFAPMTVRRGTWVDWLFWKCMFKVQIYGPEASRRWEDTNDTRPYSKSIYPDDHYCFRQGMEINYYAVQMGKWKEMISSDIIIDIEDEMWLRW